MGARTRRALVGMLGLFLALPLTVATGTGLAAAQPDAADAPVTDLPANTPAAELAVPSRYLRQSLDWQECDFSSYVRSISPQAPVTSCATILVPMDWRHPDAHPDISLAIALSHATGHSQGLLTLNPGGPGLSALDNPALFATAQPRLFADYDLLGFDPRGYGHSELARCPAPAGAWEALPSVPDLRVRNAATHRVETATARLQARACASRELNRFVGTQQTVDDLEFLRTYLSRHRSLSATAAGRSGAAKTAASYDRLNYLGYSYGTWLGAWYADSYPTHTGRFILDSNMNWTSSMYANQRSDSFSFQRRRDRMLFPWIARHNRTYHLGTTRTQVKRRYEVIRAGVLRAYRAGRAPASAMDLDAELLGHLYSDADFPVAAETMVDYAELAARRVAAGSRRDATGTTDTTAATEDVDSSQLVRCNDSGYAHDVAPVLKRADADTRSYPFIGYWDTVGQCNYWPYPATTRTIDLAGAPRLLMFQSEGDPATAYEGAVAAHQATAKHTRLVSVDDEGQHGLYLTGVSPCVERIGNAFLFDGRMPAADIVCHASRLTGDAKAYPFRGPLDGYGHRLNAVTTPGSPAAGRAAPPASPTNPVVQRLQRRVAVQETQAHRAP
ncbi:alpha/beta fold hydrolase [uncultured Friedmanniella sp.]|uniref:alpha/beta fold hydrolase n=1 Tax=uncultured Friedmanniella sp. TaxID=335381 RepID=UPI0035CB76DE